ncbi:hypothetical protein [Paenibacillus glacialis]|uniref:Ig-like domain-containing protein n=1 Tax=Paenibacillus glacialis TaxID=494026 RepID=A0A168E7U8_9BACL|nr:hypothetical protein [Paenibacillus glacialis]OAB34968.1 hypothetical protein PGLA_22720 [Paenibacillus glacialis]
MANYSIFNQIDNPLYTQQVNTYIAPGIDSTPEGSASKAGMLFSVNFSSNVTAPSPLVLQVTNPLGSGKNMYISRVSGSSAAAAIVLTILKNGTVSGSAVTKVNLNFGSAAVSVMTAQSATAAVTGSPATVESMLLAAGPFVINYTGRIIVPPNNALTVTCSHTGSSTAATASIYWWEY